MTSDEPPRGAIGKFIGTRRDVLIGGSLLAAAGIAFVRKPRERQSMLGDAKLEDLVPKTLGGWKYEASSGLVLPPQDQLRDSIYSQLLTRVYSRDGIGVMLLIAYSAVQDGVLQVHRPEVCYPASGYRLTRVRRHEVPLSATNRLPGRFIIAESNTRREQLIYWTRLGRYFPDRWSEQRLAVAQENMAGIIPDGVLVRMSTVAPGDAQPVLDGFSAELYRSIGARMRSVLIGPA